ncbi:MAG: hypothetical protein KGI27_02070 [Thaumarchaeota archaeon]|nr:hypothetical protein [Nitrososphaerota archaeon]
MDQKRKKRINKFAVLVLLVILVPELVGHVLFDKPHPTSSSINAAISLTNKMDNGYHIANFGCRLAVHDDPTSSNITRAAGLDGEYGTYDCGTS